MYLTEYIGVLNHDLNFIEEQFPPEQDPNQEEQPSDPFAPMKKTYLYDSIKNIRRKLLTVSYEEDEKQDDINDFISFLDLIFRFYNLLSYEEIMLLLTNFMNEIQMALGIKLPELEKEQPENQKQ